MTPPLDYHSFLELLQLIAAGKLSGDALANAKKRIKEFLAKNEYGFTPDTALANELKEINDSELYKRFKECIGKHPYLSLVKLGLTFQSLSEEGLAEKIRKIKNEVYKNPKYGIKGIIVLNMGSTGALPEIIRYLSDLKIKKNYDERKTSDVFNGIIEGWERDTIFHQTTDGPKKLELKLLGCMNQKRKSFFVFACGTAAEQAMKKIASLKMEKEFTKRGYMFSLIGRKIDKKERKLLAWVFEKTS